MPATHIAPSSERCLNDGAPDVAPEVLAPCEQPSIRLVLVSKAHEALYGALYSSPDVMRAISTPLDHATIAAQFRRVVAHNGCDTPGHRAWVINTSGHPEPLGLVALLRDGSRAELGIMLWPSTWRRGVATHAIRATLDHAFGPMGIEHVDASRADDGHALVIDRLLAPFGFEKGAGLRSGERGWHLPKRVWRAGRGLSK